MPTRINEINGIIITITIKIKTIYIFGIKIFSIIRTYKPSPLRGIITCIEEIPTCFGIVVITTVSDGVGFREESVFKGIGNNRMIAISIITVFG